MGFSLCFALTFLFMGLSYLFLSLTREPHFLGRQAKIGRSGPLHPHPETDTNFRAFLGVRVLSQFGGMAFAFYVIYAVQQYGMSDVAAAVMVAILLTGR